MSHVRYTETMAPSSHLFPLKKNPKHVPSLIALSVNPETLRIITYIVFWFMIAVGSILTFLFVPSEELAHSALIKTFRYNNICILLDYAPSRYWTSILFHYVEIAFYLYIFLIWVRTFKAYQQELISYSFLFFSTLVSIVEVILLSLFHMIFIIGADENIMGHSLPFVGVEILLLLNAVHNFLFYQKCFVLPSPIHSLGILYVIVFIFTTLLKIEQQFEALFHMPFLHLSVPLLQTIDRSWLVLAGVIPLFLAFYFRKKIAPISLHV